MEKKLCLIILMVFAISLSAQEYIFEKITTREGLSQNDVNCIFQDKSGFLWIGTNDGLNRYDGYSFRTYRINEGFEKGKGLSSNLIYKVKEDYIGRLWLATSNEGVCVFDKGKELFTQIRNDDKNPIKLTSNRVFDIECMTDSTVWVATEKGVTIIEEINGKFETTNLISIADSPVVSKGCNVVFEDSQQRKWLGFLEGLVVCTENDGRIITKEIKGFEEGNVRSIDETEKGFVIGYEDGVIYLEGKDLAYDSKNSYLISKSSSTCVYIDEKNKLYSASQLELRVYQCDFTRKKFKHISSISKGDSRSDLNSSMVMSIYGDSSGIMWVGTNGGGLNKYNPKRKKINHYYSDGQKGCLSSNKIRAIFQDSEQNIWIGTEGGGLNYHKASSAWNFDTGFKHYASNGKMVENRFYAIAEVVTSKGEKEIWTGAGYPEELIRFDVKGNLKSLNQKIKVKKPEASIFSMIIDKEENVWIGTYGSEGLFKYSKTNGKYKNVNYKANGKKGNLPSNIIRSLLQDDKGNIWIGTDAGLCLLCKDDVSKKDPFFHVFKHQLNKSSSLSNDYILPIFQSKSGAIWVGTMGGGLNKVNYHENPDSITFSRFGTKDGFPNNVIKGILEDEKNCLWVSSNKGITCFNPSNKELNNYDMSDGLQDNEFSELACCKLSDGMMIFGGVNGFNTFYPAKIKADNSFPMVAFTDLQVLNESVKVGEKIHNRVLLEKVIDQTDCIELKYSENSFAIYFSALHFSASQKNRYKYMLEGFDKEWIEKGSEERFAKYTSLKPGKYVFKLYASNNDGAWSKDAREIDIVVIPPWWRSGVALGIYFVIFALMLMFFRRFSFIRIKHKNKLLMEHFEKEKMEELTQMKFRFFTNISHEFRTPLTLILGSVQKLLSNNQGLPEEVIYKHKSIQRNSSIMLRLINQLMDFRKIEQDKMELRIGEKNIVPFLDDIYSSFKELASANNIHFKYVTTIAEMNLWVDIDKIEKIVYNLLSNAFKFTRQGGNVQMILIDDGNQIVIQVKDDGIGIPKNEQKHVFKRFYQGANYMQSGFSGTGIGLSYSKALAELHQGDICFESIDGVGSCFELVLKKGKNHYKSSDLVMELENLSDISSIYKSNIDVISNIDINVEKEEIDNNRKYSVLIVEDNQELLHFLKDAFRSEYNVYISVNGDDALRIVEKEEIDIVISDVAMPVKDGFELCSEIKTNEKYSHIPVILLTAKSTKEDTVKGFSLGADAYIPKPFDINILEVQVASVIKNKVELKHKFSRSVEINPSEVTTTNADAKFLQDLLKIIEDNITNDGFSVEQLSELYGMQQNHINKKLKSLTGQTASGFIRTVRIKRAGQLLKTGRYTVADVTYEVGFSDLKYFRTCFKKEFKINPSEFIKQYQEEE